jgi:hypothetical protein
VVEACHREIRERDKWIAAGAAARTKQPLVEEEEMGVLHAAMEGPGVVRPLDSRQFGQLPMKFSGNLVQWRSKFLPSMKLFSRGDIEQQTRQQSWWILEKHLSRMKLLSLPFSRGCPPYHKNRKRG